MYTKHSKKTLEIILDLSTAIGQALIPGFDKSDSIDNKLVYPGWQVLQVLTFGGSNKIYRIHYQLSDDCSIREFCHYLHCYGSTGGENLRFIKCHQVVAIYDLSG